MITVWLYKRLRIIVRAREAWGRSLNYRQMCLGYLEPGEYNPSLELAFRISEFFELPIEAIFSRTPFKPLSEELYHQKNSQRQSL